MRIYSKPLLVWMLIVTRVVADHAVSARALIFEDNPVDEASVSATDKMIYGSSFHPRILRSQNRKPKGVNCCIINPRNISSNASQAAITSPSNVAIESDTAKEPSEIKDDKCPAPNMVVCPEDDNEIRRKVHTTEEEDHTDYKRVYFFLSCIIGAIVLIAELAMLLAAFVIPPEDYNRRYISRSRVGMEEAIVETLHM